MAHTPPCRRGDTLSGRIVGDKRRLYACAHKRDPCKDEGVFEAVTQEEWDSRAIYVTISHEYNFSPVNYYGRCCSSDF